MSFSIVPIINSIPGIENMSFLELGVWDGKNHAQIRSKDKSSVDSAMPADYRMSTDDFFARNQRRFDIVFVDADHRLEGGLRDYDNATKICDKLIFMHDLFPDHAVQATETGEYAGNVFRLLYHIIRTNQQVEYYVLDGDCGMTVFLPPFKTFDLEEIDARAPYAELTDLDLARFNISQMSEILRRRLSK